MEPTRAAMVAIAGACSRRLERRVHVWEVFDIGEDDGPGAAAPGPVAVVARPGSRWHDRLRQAIRASRMMQTEIAVRAGLPDETVSRIVTGQTRNPQLETLVCIAHAIGITVGWLLDEHGYSLSTEQVQRLRDARTTIDEVTARGGAA